MNTSLTLAEVGTACDDHGPRLDTACAENAQLAQWVLNAVMSRDETSLRTAPFDATNRTLPPRTLMALIVYFYAAGVYAAEDIETRLQHDGIVRLFCGPEPVDQRKILRFRRDNASIITSCLERALALAFSQPHAGIINHRRMMIESGVSTSAIQEPFAAEAQRRVRWAMFLDSVAQDN